MDDPRLAAATAAVIDAALAEDRATEDVTTRAVIAPGATGTAWLIAREPCVIAGLDAFEATFERFGIDRIARHADDGDRVDAGTTVAVVTGSFAGLLAAERTALNLVQHLSGIATRTHAFVEAAGGVPVRDTRKTIPGLRLLEKAAVVAGGGTNHRMTLAEQILIKDNHIAAVGGITEAVARARRNAPSVWLEVECETLDQIDEALARGVDEILLDNMDPPMLRAAVDRIAGRCRTEASGGVTLDTIAAIAASGVDAISVGALTHSAPAADLALDIVAEGEC